MLFSTLFYIHKFAVLLFLAIYILKIILLLVGKKDGLKKFTALVKVPEMIISLLFLLTGGYMIMHVAEFDIFLVLKLAFVFLAIPLAVIGFKKEKKLFAVISIFLIIGAYGLSEIHKAKMGKRHDFKEEVITNPAAQNYVLNLHGKALYNAQCATCHGADGSANLSGAKNLQHTNKTKEEVIKIIKSGKNTMPQIKPEFNKQEMEALVDYIKSLKVSL